MIKPTDIESLPLVEVSNDEETWYKTRLVFVNRDGYRTTDIRGEHVSQPWSFCREIQEPKTRPMKHSDVFKALSEGAVIALKSGYGAVHNLWDTVRRVEEYNICYNYTDSDTDKWEPMEVSLSELPQFEATEEGVEDCVEWSMSNKSNGFVVSCQNSFDNPHYWSYDLKPKYYRIRKVGDTGEGQPLFKEVSK